MLKSKIIIIEDEFFAANHISDLVSSLGFWVVGVYHSGEEFLAQTDWEFDAAIVDIFLSKEMTGLQVAETLKDRQKPFIFLTANQDSKTLKEAAHLSPKAYISKPFKPNDIVAALEIISHNLSPKLEVRGAHGIELLSIDQILFIKGDGVYIEIHTRKGMILQRKLLKAIEEILPDFFIRIHRSYIVNENYIEKKTSNQIIVNNIIIPISKNYNGRLNQ
jgi:DNA-binding LytR/AlgR family response regulator